MAAITDPFTLESLKTYRPKSTNNPVQQSKQQVNELLMSATSIYSVHLLLYIKWVSIPNAVEIMPRKHAQSIDTQTKLQNAQPPYVS